MAKDLLERFFRILVDDSGGTARDLSGDLIPGSVKGGGLTLDEVEMTGVSESVKNFLSGLGDSEITAQFHMNDAATTGAHTVLRGILGQIATVTVSLRYGTGAAPTTGDPQWSGEYTLLEAVVGQSGGRMVIDAKFKPSGSTAPAWGTVP